MEGRVTLSVRKAAREKLGEWFGKAMDHAVLFAYACVLFKQRYNREPRYYTKRVYMWTQSTSFGGNERKEWKEFQEMYANDRKIVDRLIEEI